MFYHYYFDFYTLSLLRLEDQLHGHPFYVRAALLAVETYMGLHDVPFVAPTATKGVC